MRRQAAWILIFGYMLSFLGAGAIDVRAPGAILIEQTTGTVLFEKAADEQMHPASVTKIMTLLLTMEAIDSGKITLDDVVTCSEKVSKMEGSKVFLSKGEKITVHELLKSIAVASGNDASVAMAEHLAGNEEAFVELMNRRAAELGMGNTHFENCTGLDVDIHLTTARDIAIMSRELLNHPRIFDYTTIWMDSLRDGAFMLANTNRLIRFYEGANGLKTGSTSVAKYCLSGTAKRADMQLIAVILGASTSDERFEDTTALLDYGFANYAVVHKDGQGANLQDIPVIKGMASTVGVAVRGTLDFVVEKGIEGAIEEKIFMAADLLAPVEQNQTVGEISYILSGQEIGKIRIIACDEVKKITIWHQFFVLAGQFLMIQ